MKKWKNGLSLVLTLCMAAGMVLTGKAQAPGVPLDSSAFPDPAFLGWVRKQDTDGDGFLSQTEREAVTRMDLRKLGIQDLSGLEYFPALEYLNCSENDLVSLELADFPALTSLTCNENSRLSELILSGVPTLEQLYCFDSSLSHLDLHGLPNLTYLAWGGSPLEELDLSGNPNLHTLHVLGAISPRPTCPTTKSWTRCCGTTPGSKPWICPTRPSSPTSTAPTTTSPLWTSAATRSWRRFTPATTGCWPFACPRTQSPSAISPGSAPQPFSCPRGKIPSPSPTWPPG